MVSGWGDTSGSGLVDRWVVLGATPLADGEYAVQTIVDPQDRLREGGKAREKSTTATACFTVRGGQIVDVRDNP